MKKRLLISLLLLSFSFGLSFVEKPIPTLNESSLDENGNLLEPIDIAMNTEANPKGRYNEGKLLVKYHGDIDSIDLDSAKATSIETLYEGSNWHLLTLNSDIDTIDAVSYLRSNNVFDAVDYDYIMTGDGETESLSVDISGNPHHGQQHNMDTHNIKKTWNYMAKEFGIVGGSQDVVVAVIDTGVDYNHLDLRENIWTNINEIPNNGIDDDNNGYIDDYHGYDFVGDDDDPMDDNGHGTHVAGIIGASNNNIGIAGVAFNCKIMPLKAASSSGSFLQSDIAEAIQYAYMNGASVINMSFGGSGISMAVEDALMDAYNQCVLVAAAGNNSKCNRPGHENLHDVEVSYPASLTYVIGVMSCNASGNYVSGFSNYDHTPYDKFAYETYAVGESVYSTFPNNKYVRMSGTSMAAPTVAGVAALLRSAYPDREAFSTKYLQSQIVNTGVNNPFNFIIEGDDKYNNVVDAYNALSKVPTPNVNLHDYYIFDNKEFSTKNNGDGVVDAGETIRLGIELLNRGGVARDVNISINTNRLGDSSITDPYFTITRDSVVFSNIGTYSVRDGNKIYDDYGNIVGVENYFEIIVSEDCPNEYVADFNIEFTYKNGMDESDDMIYYPNPDFPCVANITVSSGYKLPSVIETDTTFTAGKRYIVSHDVVIPEGVTVNFEEGCIIQFYENSGAYYDSLYNSPEIKVYGTLNFNGTQENMIKIMPADTFYNFYCIIQHLNYNTSTNLRYVEMLNPWIEGFDSINCYNSILKSNYNSYLLHYLNGIVSNHLNGVKVKLFKDSIFMNYGYLYMLACDSESSYFKIRSDHHRQEPLYFGSLNNSIVYMSTPRIKEFNGVEIMNNTYYNKTTNKYSSNNVFISYDDKKAANGFNISVQANEYFTNNTFLAGQKRFGEYLIENYYNTQGLPIADLNYEADSYDEAFPFIKDFKIYNQDGEETKTIGSEEVTFELIFSRDMDTSSPITLGFGSVEPYYDYKVEGEFISNRVWRGTYELKAFIENGTQQMSIRGGCADGEPFMTLVPNITNWEFNIDTTEAMSMTMFAESSDEGIELSWLQDDYDTLMGYNVYRSETKDGNYVKINPTLISPEENTFIDTNAEPGKTYWYTFTVVLSDFSESAPAGKIVATMNDTIKPNVYHTPVNQAYENNNLVITCTASDNIAVTEVVLYYRTIGETEWKSLTMSKQNDKYSAIIYGSEITLAGLEYYIVAKDSANEICKGSAESPYTIVVKDSSSISSYGDVDGDGSITTKDALMIMQAINGEILLTDDQFKRADLNKNGNLDSVEALRILQYINGKVTTLEM